MKPTIATITQLADGRFAAQFPFNDDLKAAIKAAVPWQEREFVKVHGWIVASSYADTLRQRVREAATTNNWTFVDETQPDASSSRAEALNDFLAQHSDAMIAALKPIARHELAVVGWSRLKDLDQLVVEVEIRGFLGDRYHALWNASLKNYPRPIIASWLLKQSGKPTISIAATPALLQALLATMPDYAKTKSLTMRETFENGNVAHFQSEKGNLYLGIHLDAIDMRTLTDYEWSHAWWKFVFVGTVVYLVEQAAEQAKIMLKASATSWFSFGGGFAVAHTEKSELLPTFQAFHALGWLQGWLKARIQCDTVEPNRWGERHRAMSYEHPADVIVDHMRKFGNQSIMPLLDMTEDELTQHQARIHALKVAAAQAWLDERRANARILALAILEKMTKQELLELAEQGGLPICKAMKKDQLITMCANDQPLCEAVLNLPATISA